MKHSWKITTTLLCMFLVTQLIGLAVIHADVFHLSVEINGTIQQVSNPQLSWIQPPEDISPGISISSIIISFTIAVFLIFLLSKIKAILFLRIWFFIVVILAIYLCIYAFEKIVPWQINPVVAVILPVIISVPLAFFKIFKRNLLVHNFSELLIYPGISAVFVPILNVWTIIILLVLISAYDIYAVWHSGFMQKMAKFQINQLKFFAGFFVPYLGKKDKEKIKIIKQKYKNQKTAEKQLRNKKIKVSLAILGGGDVIFPIIAAGIFLKSFGLISSLLITFGATIALAFLFITARKGKFYPAMPFLTAGIFLGMLASWILI